MAHNEPSLTAPWEEQRTTERRLAAQQAEALVEMAVPVLRDMLRDYRRKQAEEAKRREEEEQPVPVTAEVRP